MPDSMLASIPVRSRLRSLSRNGALTCLLGFAATRIWTQGVLYDSYRQSDGGMVSLLGSLIYSAVFLAVALLSLKHPRLGQKAPCAPAFILMVCAPFAAIAYELQGGTPLLLLSSTLAGIGMVAGFLLWSVPYSRLDFDEAVLYTFATMAVTAVGGLALSFVPRLQSLCLCVLLAPVVLASAQKALRIEPAGDAAEVPNSRPVPHRTFWVVIAGAAVFGLVLGVSRGYPAGAPIGLNAGLRAVHQLGVVAFSAAVIGLTLGGRPPRLETLWRTVVGVGACAVLLLLLFPGQAGPVAVAIVNIANSVVIGAMWLTAVYLVQTDGWHPYTACGLLWCARGVFRDLGRALLIAVPAAAALPIGIGVAVLALAVSAALLLSEGLFPGAWPARRHREAEPEQEDPVAPEAPLAENPPGNDFDSVFLERAQRLAPAYGLTERETQVAALIARGYSKAHTGELLGLKESTVRTHAKNVYAKLDVQSRAQLMELLGQGR